MIRYAGVPQTGLLQRFGLTIGRRSGLESAPSQRLPMSDWKGAHHRMPSLPFRPRGGFSLRRLRVPGILVLLVSLVAFASATPANAQTGTVQGKVVDQSGMPLPGVNVVLLGLNTGGISNAAGEY